jgi:hypothetical protein
MPSGLLLLPAQTHRVKLTNDPIDPVITPEQLAIYHQGWHAEHSIAIGFGEASLEARFRLQILISDIPSKLGGISPDLVKNSRERVGILDLEFPLPESFKNPVRISAKEILVLGGHTRVKGETSAVNFLGGLYNQVSFRGGATGVEIQIPQFAAITFVSRFDLAAIDFSNIDAEWDEMEFYLMGAFE